MTVSSGLLTDVQSAFVPGVHVLHGVLCQYRDLSDCRCADQENATSLSVPARFLQVSENYNSSRACSVSAQHCTVIPELICS